jgi:AP-1 complex subunit beta-1
MGSGPINTALMLPKENWLPANKGKGLEVHGTFCRRVGGQICMEMTFTNKALQAMTEFAIQLNKNSFSLCPAQPLQVPIPFQPNQTANVSLPLNNTGAVMKMDPLLNLQVAVKNNVDVFYFATLIPMHVLFSEDGEMEKRVFLATWKDIPGENEAQFTVRNIAHNADVCSQKLQACNVFTIAKRTVDGQDMLYQSVKLINGIYVLAELKIQPGNPNFTLSLKSRAPDVYADMHKAYETILS